MSDPGSQNRPTVNDRVSIGIPSNNQGIAQQEITFTRPLSRVFDSTKVITVNNDDPAELPI
jgi:hypothetical protein